MGHIENLRLFVQILESGSISKAAAELNVAKSAISRRLSLLEERYETVLIERSPGSWRVTETGKELHRRAVRLIEDADELDADFVSVSADLSGPLSVSVPRDFGLGYLGGALTAFKDQYPEIALTVDFDDRVVDLSQENYDFAIRITGDIDDADDASLIGTVEHALYASPDYLAAHVTPHDLEDLRAHQLLNYGRALRASWEFVDANQKKIRIEFKPFMNSNSGQFLVDATISGLGISRLPDFLVKNARKTKSLVRVLPEVKAHRSGIYLLHQQNRHLNRRMRVFIEEIKKACVSMA